MIADSVAWLKENGREVVYDAEHFFDGYTRRPRLRAAHAGGGGATRARTGSCSATPTAAACPRWVAEVVRAVRAQVETPLGAHTHNDGEMAVANALAAVEAGCTQVQGTINGYGERCGNANLVSIIPALQLKMGRRCVPRGEPGAADRAVADGVGDREPQPGRARALRRGVGLRAQGRRARGGGGEAGRELRAHPAGAGGQPPPRRRLRAVRAAATCACARASWAWTRAGRRRRWWRGSRSWRTRATSSRPRRARSSCWSGAAGRATVRRSSCWTWWWWRRSAAAGRCWPRPRSSCASAARRSTPRPRAPGPCTRWIARCARRCCPHYPGLADVRLADYKVRILDPQAATGARTRVLIEAARGERAVEHDRGLAEHHRGQRPGPGRQPGAAAPARRGGAGPPGSG